MQIDDFHLRSCKLDDARAYSRFMQSNAERFRSMMPEFDLAEWTEAYWVKNIENWIELEEAPTQKKFLIVGPDHTIIGDITYSNIVMGPLRACYLGYKLDGAYEGRGIMSRALDLANTYMFTEIGLNRIMANYRPENVKSAALLKRLGFRIEGYAKNYLRLDGDWRDHVLTAKTSVV